MALLMLLEVAPHPDLLPSRGEKEFDLKIGN